MKELIPIVTQHPKGGTWVINPLVQRGEERRGEERRGVGEGKELSGEVHFSTDSKHEIKIHEEIYVYLCMEQNIHISNHTN